MTLRSLRNRALVAAVLGATLLTGTAAQADGPHTPFVVARGHSLYGAPWQIKFGEERSAGSGPDYATFLFLVGTQAEREECGYYSSIPLPLPRAFPFDGTFGEEFDRFPERDLSGTAGPLVSRLALKMADGSELDAELLRPPARVLKRYPRLVRFRFYDLFFPDTAEPTSITAYGRNGKPIRRLPVK